MTVFELPIGTLFKFHPDEDLRCSCLYTKIENTTRHKQHDMAVTTPCPHYGGNTSGIKITWFGYRRVIPMNLTRALSRLES